MTPNANTVEGILILLASIFLVAVLWVLIRR